MQWNACFLLIARLMSLSSTNKERNFKELALLNATIEICFIFMNQVFVYLLLKMTRVSKYLKSLS